MSLGVAIALPCGWHCLSAASRRVLSANSVGLEKSEQMAGRLRTPKHHHAAVIGVQRRRPQAKLFGWFRSAVPILAWLVISLNLAAQTPAPGPGESKPSTAPPSSESRSEPRPDASEPSPAQWLEEVIARVVAGPPADAKLRQTVRAGGHEFVGVGSFISRGENTGRYRMQLSIHDGQGKHTLAQISDGRLAWTRTEIGDDVIVRRVDVSRLEQTASRQLSGFTPSRGVPETSAGLNNAIHPARVTPGRRVGGIAELLDEVIRHYELRLRAGRLNDTKVFVASGELKLETRDRWIQAAGGTMPSLQPTSVNVIVAGRDDPETGFGRGWPVRIEYFGDPIDVAPVDIEPSAGGSTSPKRPLISVIELHSIRQRSQISDGAFRYQSQQGDVDFVDDTDRYLKRLTSIRMASR